MPCATRKGDRASAAARKGDESLTYHLSQTTQRPIIREIRAALQQQQQQKVAALLQFAELGDAETETGSAT